MNGILFDEYGDLLRCKFAGEKNSCSSQLLVITQSKPVMFLEDYLEAEGYENLKYRLLCLEDEEAYSRTVAALMGTIMVNPVGDMTVDMQRCLSYMEMMDVEWDKTPLTLEFNVMSGENAYGDPLYSFITRDTGHDDLLVESVTGFRDLHDLLDCIHEYVRFLEQEAGIPVVMMDLAIDEDLLDGLDSADKKLFDHINHQKI